MKKYLILLAVLLLAVFSGCTTSTEPEAPSSSVQSQSDSNVTAEPESTLEAADSTVIELFNGKRFDDLKNEVGDRALFSVNSCLIWKDAEGYKIAVTSRECYAVHTFFVFSEDLEPLESEGRKPIEPFDPEEWIGKELSDFTDPIRNDFYHYHVDFGTGLYGRFWPAYVSSAGTIYWMDLDVDTITAIHTFSLKDLSEGSLDPDTLAALKQVTEMTDVTDSFAYTPKIGESIYTLKKYVRGRILEEHYSCVIWKDADGYKIALSPDSQTVCAYVLFSEKLELLAADGVEPIKEIDPETLDQWVGKTEADFVAQYGPCHYDIGSGMYYPCYISEAGTIYFLHFGLGESGHYDVIARVVAYSIKDDQYIG